MPSETLTIELTDNGDVLWVLRDGSVCERRPAPWSLDQDGWAWAVLERTVVLPDGTKAIRSGLLLDRWGEDVPEEPHA